MWVRLGSTDLMAGKIMFLRSIRVVDLTVIIRSGFFSKVIWSTLKARARQFSALFTPSSSARKTLHFPGSSPVTRGQSHPSLAPLFQKLSNIQLCVT
ncbi:hypothetical protein TNCV_2491 [Trichonephila clavipes]|nr:hypothetical protein TNCV_2491 [Trichonephila clavipes]